MPDEDIVAQSVHFRILVVGLQREVLRVEMLIGGVYPGNGPSVTLPHLIARCVGVGLQGACRGLELLLIERFQVVTLSALALLAFLTAGVGVR